LLRHSGGSHELAGVHCDYCGEAIRAEDNAVENLRARTVHHATCSKEATKSPELDLWDIPPKLLPIGHLLTPHAEARGGALFSGSDRRSPHYAPRKSAYKRPTVMDSGTAG
jgi:hypothetical protein